MRKVNFGVMSSKRCSRCSKKIKKNVADRKPEDDTSLLCYKCYRVSEKARMHYINMHPRKKRIEANLKVRRY